MKQRPVDAEHGHHRRQPRQQGGLVAMMDAPVPGDASYYRWRLRR